MSNIKYIPTKKLKEILDENYTRGVDGADYEDQKEEMEQVLWERESNDYDALIAEREQQENEAA